MACFCSLAGAGLLMCLQSANAPSGAVVAYDDCQAAQENVCEAMEIVTAIGTGPDVPDVIGRLLSEATDRVQGACNNAIDHNLYPSGGGTTG